MTLPKKIINELEEEIENLKNFGKVSLTVVCRGSHCHYEIDRHRTIVLDEDKDISKENAINHHT